jgi:serine/threonine protein kinase
LDYSLTVGRRDQRTHRDRYRLEARPLGSGGFADVFAATDKTFGSRVAFKRLRTGPPEAQRRFRREIEIQRALVHEHVMPIIDADPLSKWYVMPIAEASLEALLPVLSYGEVIDALRGAGLGLAAGHARAVVHRDVTPRNILALRRSDGTRRWVIADWGLVRLPTGESGSLKTVGTLGTVGFIAPEVVRDPRSANARSDIYSLGMVAEAVQRGGRWQTANGLDRFIAATTNTDPTRRPQTIGDALSLLRMPSEAVPRAFLVWTAGTEDAFETTLWRFSAHTQGLELVGRRPGLFICDGEHLWEWRYSSHAISLVGRGLFDDKTPAPGSTSIEDVSLVDFDTGNTRLISALEPRTEDDSLDLSRQTKPVAGAGPFLFLREDVYTDGGGAHGSTGTRFWAMDTRSGHAIEQLSPTEFASDFELEQREAIERHRSEDDSWDGEAPEFTMYRAVVLPDSATGLNLQFTFSSSYAGSDLAWSSYTRSRNVKTKRMPRELQMVIVPPALLIPALQSNAETTFSGWSELSDLPQAERWIGLFDERKST